MVFLNILKYSYIYNVIYIRLKLVFTIWKFFRNDPTGKKTETCNIRFITSRARRVNSEKTFNPTWKMQNDKNVKWRNPRRYSGLFRILRFEIFLLFIHFPTPQKFRIKLKSEQDFLWKIFYTFFSASLRGLFFPALSLEKSYRKKYNMRSSAARRN